VTDPHPLGRIGDPEDVAAAIAFLLDPANNWITGQVLGVDGGLATLKASAGRSASAKASAGTNRTRLVPVWAIQQRVP